MSIKITGLDKLQRDLDELQRAMKALDGPITKINIIPGDAQSVARGIREMEAAVDAKAAPYRNNPMVKKIVEAAKKHFTERLRERGKKRENA
jgi:hypothetical protein